MSAIALENKTILVTGAAGFIGSNLVKRICEEVPSAKVVGIDSVNDYYDVALKEFRLNELSKYESFTFIKGNIANKELITEIFTKYKPAVVVNLAAQAGVRYSITNPDAYVEANLIGFYNILEACRHSYDDGETGVEHLVFKTATGLPFRYKLKVGKNGGYNRELMIDRREKSKSLAWSSVVLAFENSKRVSEEVKKPKALGDIRGVSYIYPILWRFGLIRVPEAIEKKMGKQR